MATTHMGKLDNKAAETVKVNRWAIGLLITIAALIGFTPVTFVLGRPQLILYIFGVVATIVGLSLLFRKFQTAASFEPSFTELLLAGLNDLWLWAFIGSAWLITYGLVYWVTIQVQYVQLNADSIAFYLTVILIGCYIILVTFDEVRNTIGNLYPNTVGIRSIYYKSATHGFARLWRLQGILLLIFALFSLALWFFTKQFFSIWFYITLQVFVLSVSFIFSLDLTEDTTLLPGMSNAAHAISKLLRAIGYNVISAPRTGESGTDPLLVGLDLFAYNNERAFAVEIKTAQQSTNPIEWKVASSLLMAAFALDKEAQELRVKSEKVEPVIVLVDREPTESLKAFTKAESIHLVQIPNKDVFKILATDNQAELKGLVHEYMKGIFEVNNDVEAPSGKDSELEGGI